MHSSNHLILAAALAAGIAPGAARGAACVPQPEQRCTVVGNIHVYARSEARLDELRAPVAAAQDLFKQHFAAPVPAGALVDAGSIPEGQRSALRKAGLAWVMPWLSRQDSQALLQSSIRAQLQSQMPGATEQEIEEGVAQSLAAIRAQAGSAPGSRSEGAELMLEGALQHEIGHQLFLHAYFDQDEPAAAQADVAVYGAEGAPDWLDEAAAILTEESTMAAGRRAAFARHLRQAGLPSLKSLAEYFAMPHPGIASAEVTALVERQAAGAQAMPGGSVGNQTGVIIVDDLTPAQRAGLDEEANFYSLTRVFADFLLESSGDPAVFGKIAEAAQQRRDMGAWLAAQDAGLPFRTLAALEAGWRAWLSQRYASAPGTEASAAGGGHD